MRTAASGQTTMTTTSNIQRASPPARPPRPPIPASRPPQIDLAERRKLYRWFVRGTFLFAAHVLAVLLVLGYIFSDGFG